MATKQELKDQLNEIRETYEDLLGQVRDFARELRHSDAGHVSRRMEAYTIPWLEAFLEETTQPGSIADIEEDVEKLEEDEEDEGGEYDNVEMPVDRL